MCGLVSVGIRLSAADVNRKCQLEDAIGLVALLAKRDDRRFEKAAIRWQSRFEAEVPGVGLGDSQMALAALQALKGQRADTARKVLIELLSPR